MSPAKTPRKRLTRKTLIFLLVLAATTIGLAWDGSPLGSLVLRQALALKFRDVRMVSPAELVAWMKDPNRPPPLLIDARPEAQFRRSHIDGAVLIDPTAPDLAPLEHVTRDQPVVVYDATGIYGVAMVKALAEAGFSRLSSLDGGLFRWANEGYPMVNDQGPATTVDPINWKWGRLLKSRYHP